MKKSGYLFALVIEHNGLDLMGQKPGPSLRTFFRSDIEHNGLGLMGQKPGPSLRTFFGSVGVKTRSTVVASVFLVRPPDRHHNCLTYCNLEIFEA
jgi:hypothetical protein